MVKWLFLALVWVYRHTLSALVGRTCRFLPSCSEYAAEAIKLHGAWHGGGLALRRFCRCHPFVRLGGGAGVDEVPAALPPALPVAGKAAISRQSNQFKCD